MKIKRLVYILFCVALISCGKKQEQHTSPPNPAGYISYDLNGTRYFYTNGTARKETFTEPGFPARYFIQGSDTNDGIINIFIAADSLMLQTYHIRYGYPYALYFVSNGKDYYLQDSTVYFIDVTVTSYKDGKISGNFSGKISHIVTINPTVALDAEITQGEITNIPVAYSF